VFLSFHIYCTLNDAEKVFLNGKKKKKIKKKKNKKKKKKKKKKKNEIKEM
jgi:hypothetical protein